MASEKRKEALDTIRKNIRQAGHHIYVVSPDVTPRFAYTIGVSESIGFELVLAGAIYYMKDEVIRVVNDVARQAKTKVDTRTFEVSAEGSFALKAVHSSWIAKLLLGATDYYQKDVNAFQIVPDEDHWTIDVPDMTKQLDSSTEPIWQWLDKTWPYPVPKAATATTNLAALRGDRITEVVRWEEDEWEAFAGAGPDVTDEEMRVVPLGTLIASDESLVPIVHLAKSEGLWRDESSDWHPWKRKSV